MLYTTGWTREKVKTEKDYLTWLRSLRDDDEVLFQQFHTASDSCFSMPFERWQFERVRVSGKQLISCGDSHPFIREAGTGCYWDYESEWGNVFPARVVPLHGDLPVPEVGQSVWGHAPVYEPLYFHNYRHHAIARYGKDFSKRLNQGYKRYYWKDVDRGELLVFFSPEEPEDLKLPENVHYLYSEYLKL